MIPSHPHPLADRARRLAAVVALAGIVIGVPVVLLTFGGFPLPDHVPTGEDIWLELSRPDDGTLLLAALTWTAWTAWAIATALIALEVITQLRDLPPVRLPGLGWAQLALAGLVSTAIVGVSNGTASADTPPALTVAAYQDPDHASEQTPARDDSAQPVTAHDDQTTPTAQQRHHTVQRGDSYWSIAESELGDPERYTEIVALNQGRTMPDGTVLNGEEFLFPGWELLLPATDDQEPSTATTHTVQPGETLSSIAEHYLGDPEAYPEITDATQKAGTPLNDPDVIDVGLQVTIPAISTNNNPEDTPANGTNTEPPTPSTEDKQTTNQSSESDAGHPTPSNDDEATPSDGTDTPTGDHEQSPALADTPAEGGPTTPAPDDLGIAGAAPSESPDDHVNIDLASDDDTEEDATQIGPIVGYSGMAALGVLGILALRRRHQMRHRRPGHRIVQDLSDAGQAAEEDAHNASAAAKIELLDRALRSLAAKCAATQTPVPRLRAARVTAHECELLLDDDAPAIAISPFRAIDQGRWRLHTESSALLTPEDAAEIAAPYPGLGTIGHDDDGAQILIDLPQTGAISLHGTAQDTRSVLAALALEMATSPGTDHVNLSCVGIADDLAATAKTGRIRTATNVHECLRELEELTLEYASGDSPTEEIPAEIVLSAHSLTHEHLGRLRTIVGHAASPPIAIIAAANDHHVLPGPWQLDTTPGTPQQLPVLQRPVTLQRVTDEEYNRLRDLLRTADDTRSVPAPGWEHVPDETTAELAPVTIGGSEHEERHTATTAQADALNALVSLATTSTPSSEDASPPREEEAPPRLGDYEVRLRVLGPVELTGPDPSRLEPGKRKILTELTCLLRLRPGRTPDQISRSMGGPRGPWSTKYRTDNLSKLRVWLGRNSNGDLYFPTMSEGTYALNSRTVGCDWDLFQQLTHHGLQRDDATGTALLHEALDLVRGEPFTGTPLDRYAWAEPLKPTMTAAIIDTAHTIATRHLHSEHGDLTAARAALLHIIEIDPTCELLYRDLIRVEHHANNPDGITRAAQRLLIALENLDLEMEPETENLLRKYNML